MKTNRTIPVSKKGIVLLLMNLFINNVFCQTPLTLEYTIKYETYVIKPTWDNLSKLLLSDMSVFRATMAKYEYIYSTNISSYMAKNDKAVFFYTFTKKGNVLIATFLPDNDGFASTFRTEIRQKLGGGKVSYENDFETYFLETVFDNFKYRIKIGISEDQEGTSTIVLGIQ